MTNETEKPAVTAEEAAKQAPTAAPTKAREELSDDDLDEVAGGQPCGGRPVRG